jgi:hypothetical protein
MAGVEGECTVAGVKGTLKDEVEVEESKGGTHDPYHADSCNGLTDEHAPRGSTFLSFVSAV